MTINANPVPYEYGNRALRKFSAGVEHSKKDTGFQQRTQESCYIDRLIETAPDEEKFPLICRHFPIASKQQLLSEATAGRGGAG